MVPPFATPEEAEQAFYEALANADLERLMTVWADDEEVACIHPGGACAHGHHAVRDSWKAVFAHGMPSIRTGTPLVLPSVSTVVHILTERVSVKIDGTTHVAVCYATNVYHKGRSGWRMVLHHASPAPDSTDTLDNHPLPDLLH